VTSFNLIPKRRLEVKSRRARMRTWIIACTAYAVGIVGAYALYQSTSEGPDVALADDITKAAAETCLLYTSPSPRDRTRSRMPSSA